MNILIGLLITAVTATTPAAKAEKIPPTPVLERMPVYLQTDAQDAIGAIYVAKFRDALDGSSGYRPVMNPSTAKFVIAIVTMDPNEAEPESKSGHSTVASITLQRENATGLNHFVYSWVLVAKWDKVDALASALVAAIDKEIQELEGAPVTHVQ